MNENSASVDLTSESCNSGDICNCVYQVANVVQCHTAEENIYRFAGKTMSSGADALITVKLDGTKAKVIVNCEKMVICSMLLKDLKTSLTKA